MFKWVTILLFWSFTGISQTATPVQTDADSIRFDFYGDSLRLPVAANMRIQLQLPLSTATIQEFYAGVNQGDHASLLLALNDYRKQEQMDDWLYYQLIRTTAEQISPKAANYHRYTLYKWFLMAKSGYATTTRLRNDTLLLYIQSEEEIFDIPFYREGGKQYVCLNYHDYGSVDFGKSAFQPVPVEIPEAKGTFSYRVTQLPDFKPENYTTKNLRFDYKQQAYQFNILLNPQVQKIFTNYPTVDYAYQFNIPLSKTTYNSLIPLLRKAIQNKSQKNGIDYLMHFTRSAFAFETDTEVFGKEKRLSPEQTLLFEYSDCEDRAAFFFFLVKELYNLPMIVLSYPTHITIAIQLDSPLGNPILYKGLPYWVCEPTPQKKKLRVGQLLPSLRQVAYDVVYEYTPRRP